MSLKWDLMSAWQHMWGLITKFFLSSLLIWLCRDYDAHFTQSCAEFRQQQHRSINASQPQQLVLCPRNLAYISLRAESVPFGILQQIPLPHFSGGLEHFGKNVFLMRPIWCSRCYLGYSKGDTVAHHRENRFPKSALTHAKNPGKWVNTLFPIISA